MVAVLWPAGMNVLCSDKTGTLTLNKMVIQEETPIFAKVGIPIYQSVLCQVRGLEKEGFLSMLTHACPAVLIRLLILCGVVSVE
jgi:magnesium-transporting ATPase (P-type)